LAFPLLLYLKHMAQVVYIKLVFEFGKCIRMILLITVDSLVLLIYGLTRAEDIVERMLAKYFRNCKL